MKQVKRTRLRRSTRNKKMGTVPLFLDHLDGRGSTSFLTRRKTRNDWDATHQLEKFNNDKLLLVSVQKQKTLIDLPYKFVEKRQKSLIFPYSIIRTLLFGLFTCAHPLLKRASSASKYASCISCRFAEMEGAQIQEIPKSIQNYSKKLMALIKLFMFKNQRFKNVNSYEQAV